MLKHYMNKAFVYIFLGGFSFSLGTVHGDNYPSNSRPYYGNQNQPTNPPSNPRATGKEEIAYVDNYYPNNQRYSNQGYYDRGNTYNQQQYDFQHYTDPQDVRYRNHPMTDWDYKEAWQYSAKDYFQGKTQPEVWRQNHPYGYPGIGYDGDPEYLRLERMEEDYRQRQLADNNNPRNSNRMSNPNANRPYNYQNNPGNYQNNPSMPNSPNNSNTQNATRNKTAGVNSDDQITANERAPKKESRTKRNRLYTDPRKTDSKS